MMSRAYQQVLAKAGAAAIRYAGLVDVDGDPVGDRVPVKMSVQGIALQPTEDLTFRVPAGSTVAGWRVFDQAIDGTNFGGADLMPETYTGPGEYVLLADGTGIDHAAG